ncbi:MAG: hypothetical protein DSY32_01585, partial [Aquifex sp.]
IKGNPPEEELQLIADIVARYSKNETAKIGIYLNGKEIELIGNPPSDEFLERFKIYAKKEVGHGR